MKNSLRDYKTPHSVATALRNAFFQIRALEFDKGRVLTDQEQLRIATDHVVDFIGGKALVAEYRRQAIREFVAIICSDDECIHELLRALGKAA